MTSNEVKSFINEIVISTHSLELKEIIIADVLNAYLLTHHIREGMSIDYNIDNIVYSTIEQLFPQLFINEEYVTTTGNFSNMKELMFLTPSYEEEWDFYLNHNVEIGNLKIQIWGEGINLSQFDIDKFESQQQKLKIALNDLNLTLRTVFIYSSKKSEEVPRNDPIFKNALLNILLFYPEVDYYILPLIEIYLHSLDLGPRVKLLSPEKWYLNLIEYHFPTLEKEFREEDVIIGKKDNKVSFLIPIEYGGYILNIRTFMGDIESSLKVIGANVYLRY